MMNKGVAKEKLVPPMLKNIKNYLGSKETNIFNEILTLLNRDN